MNIPHHPLNAEADFDPNDLGIEILLVTTPIPGADHITDEILRLDRMIREEEDDARLEVLCAAYRALNWARCPSGFRQPSLSRR